MNKLIALPTGLISKFKLGLIDRKKIDLAVEKARLEGWADESVKEYQINQIKVEIELLENEAIRLRERLVEIEGVNNYF